MLVSVTAQEAPAPVGPYSQAIRAGQLLFLSGQIPLDPATGALVEGDATQQAARIFDNLEAVLREAGSSLAYVCKTTVFVIDLADFSKINEVYAQRFGAAAPARSTIQVAALPLGARVEIEAIAFIPPAAT